MRQLLAELSPEEIQNIEIEAGKIAANGDVSSFETIYDLYSSRLTNTLRYQFNDFPPAEDLAQDTFTKAFEAIQERKFRYQGRTSMYNWLMRIAVNAGINVRRRDKRKSMIPTDFQQSGLDISSADDFTEEIASQDFVNKTLDSLPSAFAEVVRGIYINGNSYAEQAEEMDIERPTVGSRIFRAKGMLRDVVKREDL